MAGILHVVSGSVLTKRVALAAAAAALMAGSALAFGQARGAGAATVRTPSTGVVVVTTNLGYQGGAAAGTGIVLPSGEVLTNNHVIRGATAVQVTDVATGRTFTASVAGYDVSRDIAVLKLANAHGLSTATIGNSAVLRVGDRVTAVGNAGGTGSLTVSTGALTGLHRSITVTDDQGASSRLADLIETSAQLQPGDSGGPLLTSSGRVIGVDAAGSSGAGYRVSAVGGYAIPINTAIAIAKQVDARHRSATVHIGPTAFLGVALAPTGYSGPDVSGAIVQGVVPGSPADRAGVGSGALITSFGGHAISSRTGLPQLLFQASPGSAFRLVWVDQYGTRHSATVRPVSGPPQ
jgi:S1-C subfamily serine protease